MIAEHDVMLISVQHARATTGIGIVTIIISVAIDSCFTNIRI